MTIGLAGVLPAAVFIRRDDINDIDTFDGPHYQWWDLLTWRNGLGLLIEELAPVLRVNLQDFREREQGARGYVGPYVVEELIAMEEFVGEVVDRLLASAPADGTVLLKALVDQVEFEAAYPDALTLRDLVPYPLLLQHTAVGRVAAELSRQGRDVEVYRGDRRGDLTVRRRAAGLLKDETARLLGIDGKKYAKFERSTAAPPAGLVAELQAVDDFIVETAGQLDVTESDGVSFVTITGDREVFEQKYPHARTKRDGTVYPLRVLRVAAARRAAELDAADRSVRIIIVDG